MRVAIARKAINFYHPARRLLNAAAKEQQLAGQLMTLIMGATDDDDQVPGGMGFFGTLPGL